MSGSDILTLVTVFVLSAFVGFEVISKVPSVLHTPLMSGTNAVHGVVLVGSMAILGTAHGALEVTLGFIAVVLSTVNVVGGFVVTDRMLEMFKGRQPGRPARPEPAAAPNPPEAAPLATEPAGPEEPANQAEAPDGAPGPAPATAGLDQPTEFLSPAEMPAPPLGSEATEVLSTAAAPPDDTQVVEIDEKGGEAR